eukprot:403374974
MISISKKLHDSSKTLRYVQAQNMMRQIEDLLISTLELGQLGVNKHECKIKISVQLMPFENNALASTASHFSLCSYLSNASDPFSTMKFFFSQQNAHSQHFEYDLQQFDRCATHRSSLDTLLTIKHVQSQNMMGQIEDLLISTLELGQLGVNKHECKIKISVQLMPFENNALASTASHFSLCSYLSNASDPFSTMKFFFSQQNAHSQHFEYDLQQFDRHVQSQNMMGQIEDLLISTLELGQLGVNKHECKIKISVQLMPFENNALASTASHFSLCSYLSNASDPFSTMKFFFSQQNAHSQHFEYDLQQFDRCATHRSSLTPC